MSTRTASFRMYLSATFALLGAMSFGCVIGWSGIVLENLKKPTSHPCIHTFLNGTVTEEDLQMQAWISSNAISLGTVLGSLFASFIICWAGRRNTMIALAIPMITGWTCIGFASNLTLIIIGRAITGFCSGLIATATPSYLMDISTPARRGLLGAAFEIMISVGELYEACFSYLLNWNHLSYVAIVPTIGCSLGMLFFTTGSPIGYVFKGNILAARRSLILLRTNDSDIEEELRELQNRVQLITLEDKFMRYSLLKRCDVYWPALICVILMVFQQFSGVSTFILFLKSILKWIVLDIDSNVAIIIVYGAHVGATIHAAIIMDKFGRKLLLLISGIGETVALVLMGLYYRYYTYPNSNWFPVACLMLFVVMYSLGFGTIPWMIASEMVPHEAIPLVSSLVNVTFGMSIFVISTFVESLTELMHNYGVYWLFAGINTIAVLFTLFCVPETNGRTIEDMQRHFIGNRALE